MASSTWVTGELSLPGISKIFSELSEYFSYLLFTSWGHLIPAPGRLDRHLLPGAVLKQLGHPLALPDAVQEEEVPPGVLRQVLVGLHPLTQKGEIRMKLFCASLTAGYQLLSILSTVRNRT